MKKSILLVLSLVLCGLFAQAEEVPCGKAVKLEANAKPGFHFVQWEDGNTDNPRIVENVTEDMSFKAIFAHDDVTITVSVKDGIGGSVTIDGEEVSTKSVAYETEVEIAAVADDCYEFVRWSDGVTDAVRTVKATEAITLEAEFRLKQLQVTVSSNDDEMGSVTIALVED